MNYIDRVTILLTVDLFAIVGNREVLTYLQIGN